jgi:cell division protein FtsB
MKQLNTVLLVLFIITTLLEGVNIFLSNRVSTDSIEAGQLQKEIAVLNSQNNILRAKVFSYASFDSVASRAAEFGFVQVSAPISVDTPVTVAQN